jgi:hypothetical protein
VTKQPAKSSNLYGTRPASVGTYLKLGGSAHFNRRRLRLGLEGGARAIARMKAMAIARGGDKAR